MKVSRKTNHNLQKFFKTLETSGVLNWAQNLTSQFFESEVYLVGGAVRDAILNTQENKDLDFVVRGLDINSLEKFLNSAGWVEKLGKHFGILKFKPQQFASERDFEPLDIALPRQEMSTKAGGYHDFEVKFNKDLPINYDLERRDFTANAIALKIYPGQLEIIDPFDGISAIKNKTLKAVGKPSDRLSEDYTRILRAIRFACQLNFSLDKKVAQAIKKLSPHLNDQDEQGEWITAREVLAKEILKAFNFNHELAINLFDELDLFKTLMPEVLTMKGCPQPSNFHSEGDVWTHTRLALQNLDSRKFQRLSKKVDKLLGSASEKINKDRLELIFAVLFHDLGKPATIQTPEADGVDRIRFNDHDNVGANLAQQICERLKLSAPKKLGLNCDRVSWLVRKHMMLIHGHPSEFRPTTIEKYFFSENYPGHNLIKLAYLDSLATIPETGKLEFDLVRDLLKRIKSLRKLVKQKKAQASLPEPLLNGDEIMEILNLEPGTEVGAIKDKLRSAQLDGQLKTKAQAEEFIKNLNK